MIQLGDKIEFPFNDRMYFEQAVESIERNDFEAALENIEKVYANDKSNGVNHFYTLVLYTLDRFEEALEIANEQKNFYYQNEKHTVLYTNLLIKNQLFLEAEVLIQEHIENIHSIYHAEWQNLEKELNLERELVNYELEMQKKTTKRELGELENYSPMKQSEIIGNARDLELKELQEFARLIFFNPHTTGVTKRAFLELLVEKQDPNTYLFPWFDQQKEVVPRELEVFEHSPIVEVVDQIIEQKLHKYPSLFEIVKVEVINDLLMLYPFMEEVILDIDYWVGVYIDYFDAENQLEVQVSPQSKEQDEMKKWIEYLNQIAQRNSSLD